MERSTTALRKLLAGNELILAPGAYDAFTARLIESLGFPIVYAGGNATGTHLCIPEPFLSLSDMLEHAARILHVIDSPLVIDAGTGFGDGVHIHRSVREIERVGVAGIHIEDQVYPKPVAYHRPRSQRGTGAANVVPLQEMVDRLKRALDARRDPDFIIIGRTDALSTAGGMNEVLERCHAFQEIGIDAIFVAGLPTAEQGKTIRREVKGTPLTWISGAGADDLPVREVADMGYQLMIYPSTQALVADGFFRAFSHVRDKGTFGVDLSHILESHEQIMKLLGMREYWEIDDTGAGSGGAAK